MKKLLLLTFVASLFAAGSAFAHCGACGAAEEAHDHAHATAEKACCGTDGSCCKDKSSCDSACKMACPAKAKCCGTDGKCCKEAKAKCCGTDGKCCKSKDKDETAVASPPACCPASKAGKPA